MSYLEPLLPELISFVDTCGSMKLDLPTHINRIVIFSLPACQHCDLMKSMFLRAQLELRKRKEHARTVLLYTVEIGNDIHSQILQKRSGLNKFPSIYQVQTDTGVLTPITWLKERVSIKDIVNGLSS